MGAVKGDDLGWSGRTRHDLGGPTSERERRKGQCQCVKLDTPLVALEMEEGDKECGLQRLEASRNVSRKEHSPTNTVMLAV